MASNEVIIPPNPTVVDDNNIVGRVGDGAAEGEVDSIVQGRDSADEENRVIDRHTRKTSLNDGREIVENEIDTNHTELSKDNGRTINNNNILIINTESNNNNINANNNNNCKREIVISPTSVTDIHVDDPSQQHRSSISCCSISPSRSIDSNSATQEDLDEISRFFENKQPAIERWLREKAPSDVIARIHDITADNSLAPHSNHKSYRSPHRASVTSDIFQQWLTSASPVKKCRSPTLRSSIAGRRHLIGLDEGELFMELIKDVANELDIDVLCHKILVNVELLTYADRGSLFLAKGTPSNRYLVAKLFDVTQDTTLDDAVRKSKSDEIIIPWGVGIAGAVAQTKETINIKEAYKDPRFNCEIDLKTGYKTNSILSMPICNYEGDVIGVAQIINKTNGCPEFTERDIEVFRRYLTFCGIGLQNAQLFEMSVQEFRRNQILLNLARNIFSEQNNLECLVTKIMTEAKELLKCERCAVYLLDLECCEASHLERVDERPGMSLSMSLPSQHQTLSRRQSNNINVEDVLEQQKMASNSSRFTMIFELDSSNNSANISRPTAEDLTNSILAQIAQYVALSGETLNIANTMEWIMDKPYSKNIKNDESCSNSKTILCMPIINGQKVVIGVAQLINKENDLQFTSCDISIFEAFAIFCGLGIHNTQMYESACKLMAKQKVALECLSYHATASQDQTLKLVNDTISPAESYKLYSFKFIDFDLSDEDTCRATVRMFLQCNLVQQFHIPYDVLCRWILSVRKNYRPVKYHNWRHALNVAQTMFAMLKTGKMERFMTDLEILGLLVACLCHDLDHRGTNNAFQTKTESPLAILYTTSTMEHHHFDQCVMILNSEGNNIFQALSPEDYRTVMRVVETAILSTDLAMYFKKRTIFMELIENGEFDWQSEEKKEVLCGMMMTACDVSAIAKPWEIQHHVAKLVADEFFDQGDLEKLQLNTQPVAMMDRERKDELPKMQVGFIDVICLPLYRVMTETFPWIHELLEGTVNNRQHWQDLAEKVEMGLTWIDHDTIDQPIEEFAANAEAIEDIEFTVTTLNCHHNDEQQTTPTHERRPRFSSLRKSGALSKAVRNRLSKSMYNNNNLTGQKGDKGQKEDDRASVKHQHSTCEDEPNPTVASGHHENNESVHAVNTGAHAGSASAAAAVPSTTGATSKTKSNKKRSKLCSLL